MKALVSGFAVLALALFMVGGMVTKPLVDLSKAVRSLSNARWIYDEAYNQHTEAGIAYPTLQADDPVLLSRRILITSEINERSAHSVVEKLFFLDSLDPEAEIDLFIGSSGGWSDSAFIIIDAMGSIHAKVNTHAIGGCYSAGTMILVAGTGRRFASPNAVISVHINNDEPDPNQEFASDPLYQAREERLFKSRSQLPEDWYPMVGNRQFYLTPEEALELGIIDVVSGSAADQTTAGAE